MHNLLTTLKSSFWIVILLLLAGCGSGVTPTASTEVDVNAISTQAVATFVVQMTETAASQPTANLTPTALLTETPITPPPAQTPLPSSLPKFPLDGYVMLFTKDDDLYFQDGENSPIKLAHIEGKIYPPYFIEFSDDNQKVVFYQDDGNIYSINTDGTQKQIIIPSNWLNSLEAGTFFGVLDFIPKTHLLFFETMLCKEKSSISLCSTTIFLADTDTGEIRKLANLGLALQNHSPHIQDNIIFSPDGKMLAVGTMDGVKIFTLDGKVIRQKVLPYTPHSSVVPFPPLFWLPDSSGLIVALPDKSRPDPFYADGTAPAYTIWRYMIASNDRVQIPFDPLVAGSLLVSPDGNWIVYGVISLAATELYLGNLADGSTKIFGNDLMKNFSWSPDSKHFIHGNTVVISFDKLPVYGGAAGPGWIDSNHFAYPVLPANNSSIQLERFIIAEIRGDEIFYYESGLIHPRWVTIKPKQ